MYRLLIVTARPEVKELFARLEAAGLGGFKAPHFRTGLAEAQECLRSHSIDAIALDSAEDHADVLAYLETSLPDMPLFTLAGEPEDQRLILRELERMLLTLRADDTNSAYNPAARLEEARARWMKRVMSGLIPAAADMERQILLYRFPGTVSDPCWLGRLSIPRDDAFLSERWHYGSDRLETALRNFFGAEHDGMRMHVAVVSPDEVRVLVIPEGDAREAEKPVAAYLRETASMIEHYLGLALNVEEICLLPGLKAFAGDSNE